MQNKKPTVLIILIIAAVISLAYGIITPAAKRARTHPATASLQQGADVEPAGDTAHLRRLAKRTRFTRWARSPFAPKTAGGGAEDLVLSGIIWSPTNPKAMIGDSIVGKGGRVGDSTVVDIKKDRVVLNDGMKNFELRLKD